MSSCFRCGELANFAYCSACSSWLERERMWQEAGFNPDDKTPFDPDGEMHQPTPQRAGETESEG